MFLKLIILAIFSTGVFAGELDDKKIWKEKEPQNFCLDKQAELDNEKLAIENPNDKELLKLVALRAGLCYLISRQIIEFDLAIDIFDAEQQKESLKRLEEEQTSNREKGA